MKMRLSLSSKLAWVLTIFAFLIVAGLAGFAFFSGRQVLLEATLAKLDSETYEKETSLAVWEQDILREIQGLVQLVELHAATLAGRNVQFDATSHLPQELMVFVNRDGAFESIMLIDQESGEVLISTEPQEIGTFKENRTYLVSGLSEVAMYGPYYSVTRQGPAITVSAPIKDPNGNLIVVLAVRVAIGELDRIVALRTGRQASDDAYLVNTSGLLASQPRLINDPAVLQRGIRSPAIERCLAGETFSEVGLDFQDVPVIAVYRWLSERSLCLVGTISQEEAFRPISSFAVTTAAGGAMALLLAIIIAIILGRRITRPILQIQAAASRVSAGAFDVGLTEERHDEIGELARDFNAMTLSLKTRTDALRDSEAQTRLLLDTTGEAIYGIDLEGRCTFVNPACAHLLGYADPADFVGKRMHGLIHHTRPDGSPYPEAECEIYVACRRGETTHVEDEVLWRADGSSFPAEYRSVPMQRDGQVTGAVVNFVDITERKQALSGIQQLNQQLEARVEARTAELRAAQADLVRKERLATLGQLTATVSHELRNPLGAMRTSTHILRKLVDEMPPRSHGALERLDRSITRCDHIIEELLDFTRISDLNITPVPLDTWLASLLEELELPEAVQRDCRFAAGGSLVPLDQDRLRRAVINIHDNACQAMADAPGPGKLTISTAVSGNRVEIRIEDEGPGIDDDVLAKIFEPLYSTKNFGVGLGLTIVKQIMQQHGGGVEAHTRQGQGSRFTLWLPLSQPRRREAKAPANGDASRQIEAAP